MTQSSRREFVEEMGELADAGAAAFTDDGRPGRERRADAPRARVQRDHRPPPRAALRGAEPDARRAHAHGRGRRPSSASAAGRRSARASASRASSRSPATRGSRCTSCTSRRASRSSCCARAQAAGRRGERRGDAAPPLPHRRGACARLDSNLKMNPPLRTARRPRRADRGAARRHDRGDRDRPRAALARGEGRAVRGGAVRGHRARDGVRRALHLPRRAGPAAARDAARADVGRPGADLRPRAAADRGRRAGEPRPARPRTRPGACARTRFRSRSANSWLLGERLQGKVAADDRRRPGRASRHERRSSCSRTATVFRGESVGAPGSRSARRSSRPR